MAPAIYYANCDTTATYTAVDRGYSSTATNYDTTAYYEITVAPPEKEPAQPPEVDAAPQFPLRVDESQPSNVAPRKTGGVKRCAFCSGVG